MNEKLITVDDVLKIKLTPKIRISRNTVPTVEAISAQIYRTNSLNRNSNSRAYEKSIAFIRGRKKKSS